MFTVRLQWALMHNMIPRKHSKILEGFFSSVLDFKVQIISILPSEAKEKYNFNQAYVLKSNLEEHFLVHLIYVGKKELFSESVISQNVFNDKSFSKNKISIIKIILSEGALLNYNETKITADLVLKKLDSENKNLDKSQKFSSDLDLLNFPKLYFFQLVFFNNEINNSLDQWLYYLKHGEILKEFDTLGLQEAASVLNIKNIESSDKKKYEAYFNNKEKPMGIQDILTKNKERIKKEILEDLATELLQNKISQRIIERVTGLSKSEIIALKKRY